MTTDTVCGVWDYAVELCQALSEFRVEVVLASMGRYLSSAQRARINFLDNVSLYESRYRLEWMSDSWRDVKRAGDWLLKIADKTRPDVVHLNGYVHGDLPWQQPVMVVCHACACSRWSNVHNSMPPAQWDCYRDRVSRALRRVDRIVTPTKTMLYALEYFYGTWDYGKRSFAARKEVIPNGLSTEKYVMAKKKPVIFSVGCLWDPAINISALEVVAKEISWPINVAGDNELPEQGIECLDFKTVKYLGGLTQEAMIDQFAVSSIYASPAKYEPYGLSVMAAALSGCALVIGDTPSMRETWGNNAMYVEPGNPEDLRDALNRLIRIPKLRCWYAERARQRAQGYMIERTAAAYDIAYADMLHERYRERLKAS